jgi:hypothetical protein
MRKSRNVSESEIGLSGICDEEGVTLVAALKRDSE